MSTIRFNAHVIGFVGHGLDEELYFAYYKWNCSTGHLPSFPLARITGFRCLMVDQNHQEPGEYDDTAVYQFANDIEDRLTYMLTNPAASLRFCPETCFSFDDPDETIFRLSRS